MQWLLYWAWLANISHLFSWEQRTEGLFIFHLELGLTVFIYKLLILFEETFLRTILSHRWEDRTTNNKLPRHCFILGLDFNPNEWVNAGVIMEGKWYGNVPSFLWDTCLDQKVEDEKYKTREITCTFYFLKISWSEFLDILKARASNCWVDCDESLRYSAWWPGRWWPIPPPYGGLSCYYILQCQAQGYKQVQTTLCYQLSR